MLSLQQDGAQTVERGVVSRDRVLSDAEIVAIWWVADRMGYPFGRLVQLLILTGQRRAEVGGMRWQEVDPLKGQWELPPGMQDRRHKSERRHLVPLSSQVLGILQSLPRVHDELAFPARGKENAISGYSKWKRKLDQLSGVKNWTLHDLRRTAATGMAAVGVPPHVIERVLNHSTGTLGGVAGIYNRFQYLDECRQALERWSQHLESLIREVQRLPERGGPRDKPASCQSGRMLSPGKSGAVSQGQARELMGAWERFATERSSPCDRMQKAGRARKPRIG